MKDTNVDYISLLKFKGKWRSYQQRVLNELNYHLTDKKLNVVAAPGAGKTTLGIEVLSRLKKNAIVFAPTITIKNQWKLRIIEGFLPENTTSDWISTDIKNISAITVSTYQALHTIYKDEAERKKFVRTLKRNNINTLVLDEAHHLRTEWYTTLNSLCENLDNENFTVVSLTGTPPYDVSPAEWRNYHSLCGPVDAEISVPELVKSGDLCPHQDLIYFSNLSKEEEKIVFDFNKNKAEFFNYINNNTDLLYSVESSAFTNDLEQNVEIIYKDTSFTISVISYLLSVDSLNMQAKLLTGFLNLETAQIPKFDEDIAQTLINGILGPFENHFNNVLSVKSKLKELNLIKNNKVDFSGKTDFKNLFARSNNKLEAIKDITKQEYSILKNDLREVILLDYIGKGDSTGLNIYSVFEKLYNQKINLAILTGTMVVIPLSAKEELYKILDENNIPREKVLTAEFRENYLRVEVYGDVHIVEYVTKLFERGFINILIGTAALLGEGWDSPCTNVLVLASIVGSFMLSNQMRGRALRTDKNNPQKTADIWHLVSLCKDCEKSIDFEIIQKRFSTFEGISYNSNSIQNGIERLNLSEKNLRMLNCNAVNQKMFTYAKDRTNLKHRWYQVFKASKINEKEMTSHMYEIVNTNIKFEDTPEGLTFWQKMVGNLYTNHKIKHSKKEQLAIAKAVLKTLCDMNQITTPYKNLKLKMVKNENNQFGITLLNGHENERSLFVRSFCEVFQFNNDIRYFLKAPTNKGFKYIPVPEIIGQKQEYVKIFEKNLKSDLLHNWRLNFYLSTESAAAFSALSFIMICFLLNIAMIDFATFYTLLCSLLVFITTVSLGNKIFSKQKLKKNWKIEMIFTKSAKNQAEVLKAKYNTYLNADIAVNRVWM